MAASHKLHALREAFGYRTPKFIKVDVWQLGLLHRVLQLTALGYAIGYVLLDRQAWAYSEAPIGKANAWGEPGKLHQMKDFKYYTRDQGGPFSYCSNSSLSYAYSPTYVMDNIACRALTGGEVPLTTGRV